MIRQFPLWLGLVIGLAACGGRPLPPVEYHGVRPQAVSREPVGIRSVDSDAVAAQPMVNLQDVEIVPARDRPARVRVQVGDTLFSLTEKYQVALDPVITLNHLQQPYHLQVGQWLNLPPPLHYRVQKGDTLYSIARKYGMDFQSLAAINGISAPYGIDPDTMLVLPSLVSGVDGGWKPAAKPKASSNSGKAPRIAPPTGTSTFVWPVQGRVISTFGGKAGGMRNDGINIAAKRGEAVHAAGPGTVIYSGTELKNYGVLILIRHPNGWVTAYAHNARAEVREGDQVKSGQVIALAGSTGSVETPQLHFETRKGVKPVNPLQHLPKAG